MRNFTILAALLLALPQISFGAVEISDGSVKALYHLEDEADSSGGGLNLTNNGVTFSTGKLGDSAYHDNSADYLSNSSVDTLKQHTLSLSFWLKTGADQAAIIGQRQTNNYKFNLGTAGTILNVSQYNSNASQDRVVNGATTLGNDQWHFVVVEMNDDYLRTWVDNNFQGYDTESITWMWDSTGVFRIGKQGDNATPFVGYIDELVVKSGSFDTSTRDALYNSGSGAEVCVTAGCGESSSTPSSTPTSTATSAVNYADFLVDIFALAVGIGVLIFKRG